MTVNNDQGEQQEIELKLEFDPAHGALIEAYLSRLQPQPLTQSLISTYYDTPDFALRDAGIALRVRQQPDRFVQTIKAGDGSGALFDRSEWELEVPGQGIDLTAARNTGLPPFADADVVGALQPLFQTRIQRVLYRVRKNGSDVEMALDWGEIATAKSHCPIAELEIELKQGSKAELFHLARTLADVVPLRLGVRSKAERGYELIEGTSAAEKARPVSVPVGVDSGQAFRIIARNCLRQIIANEPAMCEGRAEALHQMRIGLRRLRAAISFFSEVVADAEQDLIKAELKWITNELGLARDLDVLEAEIFLPLQKANANDATVATAHRHFEARRAEAYATARASIRSDRFRKAVLDIVEWVEVGLWTKSEEGRSHDSEIERFAAEQLRRLRKNIKRKGAHLRDLTVAQRHKLRIRSKQLRYALEFFAETFPGEKQERRHADMLDNLKALQEALGNLNDLARYDDLIASAAQDGLEESVTHALDSKGAGRKKLLGEAEDAYERFITVKSFWKT
ncbi:MAG: CHAD domain-containing protein [Methyloceanibacter sp.]|uniref:CYTH and CHAD domain-containing protein n=1 Tax=Methyloceanibacter sp. TaxID=1965321 RepID=UPI003D9AECBC